MNRNLLLGLFSFLFFSISLKALPPTVLSPGDFAVVSVASNTDLCHGTDDDEISFVCFKDITGFTVFQITDNGWEAVFPGFWGNTEGTLRITRAGGTVPAGTVITLIAQNNGGGNFSYSINSPDNAWLITNENAPDGPFNIEQGGDQIYFLQGGAWNHGGPNMATYGGDVIYGFTTSGWTADGTTHGSNLHPDVSPCYNMSSGGAEMFKYTGDFTPTNQFDWWHRFQNAGLWTSFTDCNLYMSTFPNYPGGFSIDITDIVIGLTCHTCTGCPPFDGFFNFDLPPGYFFDIQYSDGTFTYNRFNVEDGDTVQVHITDTTTYTIL